MSATELLNYFDRVIVISLKRRPERLQNFWKKIEGNWPFKQPTVFTGIDGSKIPVPSGAKQKDGTIINKWGAGSGAWGCMQSHRRILENAIIDGVKSLLVLEDDAEPCENFSEKVSEFLSVVPKDWDGLMLGGQHFGGIKTERIRKCQNCQRTHGYAVRGKYMKDLYAMWHSHFWHCDHAMGPFQTGYKVYAPEPFLISQGINKSDISGRLEPKRNWSGSDIKAKVAIINIPRLEMEALRVLGVHTGFSRDSATDIDRGLLNIANSTDSPINKKRKLQEWLEVVRSEASAMEMQILGIWYPEMPAILRDLLSKCLGDKLLQINATTADNFVAQWTAYTKRSQHVKL